MEVNPRNLTTSELYRRLIRGDGTHADMDRYDGERSARNERKYTHWNRYTRHNARRRAQRFGK